MTNVNAPKPNDPKNVNRDTDPKNVNRDLHPADPSDDRELTLEEVKLRNEQRANEDTNKSAHERHADNDKQTFIRRVDTINPHTGERTVGEVVTTEDYAKDPD